MRAKLNAASYRIREVQSGAGEGVGVSTVTAGNYVAPDKYHAIMETNLGGSGGRSEMILTGEASYVKTPDGKWQKKQIDPQRIKLEFARLRHEMFIENLMTAANADVKLAGQEEFDGSTMIIYQYSFTGPPEVPARVQTKIWVGTKDGLPHKIEVESRTNQKGLKISFKMTTTYYDYNADIKIEAPM